MQVKFEAAAGDGGGQVSICGAAIDTYLLEKSRVSNPDEKNFHVFYILLAATSSGKLLVLLMECVLNYGGCGGIHISI